MHITLDFETRSRCSLDCGPSKYAQHWSTVVLCLAYYSDELGMRLWTPRDDAPEDLLTAVREGAIIEAHNVFFERSIWHHICHARKGWPAVPDGQWRCSMAAASRLTLPRSLDQLAKAIGMEVQKDMEGNRLMQKLCKPKPQRYWGSGHWYGDPKEFERLYEYCISDVAVQRDVSQRIGCLPHDELKVWQLDQEINLRGIPIDIESVRNALAISGQFADDLCVQISALTGGQVTSTGQVARIIEWCRSQGVELASLRADYLADAMQADLPSQVREVLEVRLAGSLASLKKLNRMEQMVEEDGRVRGNLVYHGASTGRFSGAGVQFHNFPKGTKDVDLINSFHRELSYRDLPRLKSAFPNPMNTLKDCLRSFVRAPEGKKLVVGDFSNIEARVVAWLAGEQRLLEAFELGADPYIAMAAKIYDLPEDQITKDQRFYGKSAVLGCGYGMGAPKFKITLKNQAGVEVPLKFCKAVVKAYREFNPNIVAYWRTLNTAAIEAVRTGQPVRAGYVEFEKRASFLTILLPSGRRLFYYAPRLVEVVAPWSIGYTGAIQRTGEDSDELLAELDISYAEIEPGVEGEWYVGVDSPVGVKTALRDAGLKFDLEAKEKKMIPQVEYTCVDSQTKKWGKARSYGGKWLENIAQAIARDCMVEAMLRVNPSYPIILTVHDEIISEVDESFGSVHEFEQLMSVVPAWAEGCPIAVEGFESKRYRKD